MVIISIMFQLDRGLINTIFYSLISVHNVGFLSWLNAQGTIYCIIQLWAT